MRRVVLYRAGLCYASVCAVNDATPDEIRAAVNRAHPTGLDHGWDFSDDETFASGQPNPCPCNDLPATRQHWLMVC